MIEPHMQSMSDALFKVAWMFENMATCCMANGHHASAEVLYDIMDSLDSVWTKYDPAFQKYKQQFLHTIECDDE
jgi:hypothetical protein